MGTYPLTQLAPEVALGRLRTFGLRMRVWWARDRLTRELARGADSTDSRGLALRAGQLTAKQTREVLASSIEDLIEQAERPTAVLTAQVPIHRSKVKAAREELVGLADRLQAADPLRPSGMALAMLLLTDPEQPLFGIGSADDLRGAIIEIRQRLDGP